MIKQKRQQKMQCSKCGKVVTKQSVWAHKKSKKCLRIQGLLPDENDIENQTVGTF
jgi:phage FluMu protein Com